MLVIKRTCNQETKIGDAVVKVLSVCGGIVKLGITAPPDIEIVRDNAVIRTRVSAGLADGKLSGVN